MSILLSIILISGFHKGISGMSAGYSLVRTSDNGYLISDMFYVTKINSDASVQWSQGSMSSYPTYTFYNTLYQTLDGGYVAAGNFWYSNLQKGDIAVVKFNQNGNMVWANYYDIDTIETIFDLTEVYDLGLVCVGQRMNNTGLYFGYAMKIDGSGSLVWSRNFYFQTGESKLLYVKDLPNNDIVILGETNVNGNWDVWLFKIDQNGDHPSGYFSTIYGTANDEYAMGFERTSDNGYLILVHSIDNNENPIILIKTDSTGGVQWSKKYLGDAWPNDVPSGITKTSDGNYVISGYTIDLNYFYRVGLLFKVDESGNIIWSKTYGIHNDSYDDYFYSRPQEDTSGNLVAVGYENHYTGGLYIVKADSNGLTGCQDFEASYNFTVSGFSVSQSYWLSIGYPSVTVNPVGSDNFQSKSTYTICQGTYVEEEVNKEAILIPYSIKNNVLIFKNISDYKIYRNDGRIFKSGYGKSVKLKRGTFFLKTGGKTYKILIK